jgi:murein DD-endopeptidase MepM/ murein hydrolase activator NlpD
MKKYLFYTILAIVLSSCAAATLGPFAVDKPWGGSVPYGDGRHPGIDLGIKTGTPIIAVSDGIVILVKPVRESANDGDQVLIRHGSHFISVYAHLSKVFVGKDQFVKRGQMIALSGAGNSWGKPNYQHLHFEICKIDRRSCINYSDSLDPKMFWLGGQPQCFNPDMDYSAHSQKEITLPIACGDYGKALIAESQRKD